MLKSTSNFFESNPNELKSAKIKAMQSVLDSANRYIEAHREELKQQALEAGLTPKETEATIEAVRSKVIQRSLQRFQELAAEEERGNPITLSN